MLHAKIKSDELNVSEDVLAKQLQEDGFPSKFKLTIENISDIIPSLDLEFELFEKTINPQKTWHQISFIYNLSSESSAIVSANVKKINSLLDNMPSDENDDDLLKAIDILSIDSFEVNIELFKDTNRAYGAFL